MADAPRTIWIIAGETSGDGYGARLARELRDLQPEITIKGMGGPAMREAEVEIMVDSTELGVVGFVEVFRQLPLFIRLFRSLVKRAAEERPDTVVLIDYPGFNLRFAKRLHALGIRVVYYISPQVWAWKKGRIAQIAAWVDRLLVIFPFEVGVYDGTDLDVRFVGHPLLEILNEIRDPDLVRDPNTVLLLPGSRRGELDRLLPTFIETATKLAGERPQSRFVMPLPRESTAEHARAILATYPAAPEIEIEVGNTREWMQRAGTGLAASGTVTIEAAILGLPLISSYRLQPLTYLIGNYFIKLENFTMVNIIAGRRVFPEFLQHEVTPENLLAALRGILPEGEKRAEIETGIHEVVASLGGERPASKEAAKAILDGLNQ